MSIAEFIRNLYASGAMNAGEDQPMVVMVGTLPHTIKSIVTEHHEEGGATVWINVEES